MVSQPDNVIRPQPLDDEDQFLVERYPSLGTPVDQLPYSDEFEELVGDFVSAFPKTDDRSTRRELLARLLTLRKAGRLPRLARREAADANAPDF